jgi:hypothetical protein
MALNTEDAIRKEKRLYGGMQRNGWIFQCKTCGGEIWVLTEYLKVRLGFCRSCASARHCREYLSIHKKKRPFESLYNSGLLRRAKASGIDVDLTYEEFVEFTKIQECQYCGITVLWVSHGRQSSNQGYHLDRKNNKLGYFKENLVVACGVCNRIKNSHFSYEEMQQLAPHIRAIRCNREAQKW